MKSKVSAKGDFERIVEVEVPEAELAPHFDNALQKYRKNIKLEGFRKGKVPLPLVKKLYGDVIKNEAIDDVVQSVFHEVKEKESLRPVAPAKLDDIKYDPETGLKFKAVVEVIPDIELKKYTDLSVEREVYAIDDKDIAMALEDVREQMAVMAPVEGEAEEDHFITADLQQIDAGGVPIIGRKFDDRLFQLHKENQELTSQLLGVKAGDKRRIELPAQNPSKVEQKDFFEVTVKDIKAKKLPELDDELAKDAGEYQNLGELKAELGKKLVKQSESNSKRGLRRRLIDELLKKNSFELPETMINNYLDALIENARNQENGNVDEPTMRQEYRPIAIWNLRWELAKDKIIELEKISVTEQDKEDYITRIADERDLDPKQVRKSLKKLSNNRFEDDVLEQKILDYLEQSAKIKDKKITRKDLEKAQLSRS